MGCGDSELGTHFIDLYPSREEVKHCDINVNDFPFRDAKFGHIIANNVLEHITNFQHFFKECRRVLEHKGTMEILTDNAAYWLYHNIRSKAAVHSGGYKGEEEDRHYALFTKHHLQNMARKYGFKIAVIEYHHDFDSLSNEIKLIEWLLRKTRFKAMAFPKLYMELVK